MNITQLFKYSVRFLILQIVLTYFLIYYFDNFLIPKIDLFPDLKGFTFRQQIDANLYEDAQRFFPFISEDFIKLDIFIGVFIFVFLVFLYSTKFYTYVNELSFSLDRNYLDEYFNIYLTWTTSLMLFTSLLRFSNLIYRGYLILLTFIVPLILLILRNSEFLSSLFGRAVTNEKYLTINLSGDSNIRNLRILTFRKKINDFTFANLNKSDEIISLIDKINKNENLNLIVINFENMKKIEKKLEQYLINLNKKILLISKQKIEFNYLFLGRTESISDNYLTYFNNDIQYGSKFILKRLTDIFLTLFVLFIVSPIFILVIIFILLVDGWPAIITQKRVGLHGSVFKMYKFRTMYKNAHEKRAELIELNKNDRAIFKIDNDPRVIKSTQFLRDYSIDELPQLLNVLTGKMSLVGPRPLFKEDTELFDENYMRRLNVIPGITGLLQINERNTPDFSTWYKYDIEYIENWSLLFDLKIMLKTPIAILKKSKGK